MRPKGTKGTVHQPPRPGGPPEPGLAPQSNQPRNGQNHLRTQNWPRTTSSHISAHGLWQPPEATSSAPMKDSHQSQGKTFPSSKHPILKDPGVVHRWYNIPLCTIFSQQSNGEALRPNYVIANQVPNPSPISKENISAIPSGNSLAATRRPLKGPNHLALWEFGCQFSSGLFQGQFSEVMNH
ncbi:hypothetical protein O181_012333 [Austropuccinia psidii MF-1]|uniref:Uncharacterized protein n=1 Tax=Austropuccinia psidii MF-1 TaxID=1389203 RepID=A0A9Q3BX35_9BASI|nr:hypothetical protein [Austropuccinia psidii MF-1]